MAKIEAFYDVFKVRTAFGRKELLPQLRTLKNELRNVSDDSYLYELFTKLEVACNELARSRVSEDIESRQLVFALGDINGMRERLAYLGLLGN
jgi:hypothetical protein